MKACLNPLDPYFCSDWHRCTHSEIPAIQTRLKLVFIKIHALVPEKITKVNQNNKNKALSCKVKESEKMCSSILFLKMQKCL